MKDITKVKIIVVLFVLLVFSPSAAFAQNEDEKECTPFGFSLFDIVGFDGKICDEKFIEVGVSAFRVPVIKQSYDLSKGNLHNSFNVGVEKIEYDFYLANNCVRTKGYVKGWFHSKQTWEQNVVCF